MASRDPKARGGVSLHIEDYPYAVDGIDVWLAIEGWVRSYCDHFYHADAAVAGDAELQAWWDDVRRGPRRPAGRRRVLAGPRHRRGPRRDAVDAHLDRVGAARRRQLRPVRLRRVPAEPADAVPAVRAAPGVAGDGAAGGRPGPVLPGDGARPVHGDAGDRADRGAVQPHLRRGVPRAARDVDVDGRRRGAAAAGQVPRRAPAGGEEGGGEEQGPQARQPEGPREGAVHAALPGRRRRRRQGEGDHRERDTQQRLHLTRFIILLLLYFIYPTRLDACGM